MLSRNAGTGTTVSTTMRNTTDELETKSTRAWTRRLIPVAIVLAALNLRPAITSFGSLLEEVRDALGMSGSVAGLLTSMPPLCFAVFGVMAPRLSRRFGPGTVVCAGMVAIAAGLLIRPFAGNTAAFLAASALALMGIAVSNVLMPVIVKRWFPDRIGPMTGLYSMAVALGTAAAAAVTVPLTGALGGSWQSGLAAWASLAAVAGMAWLPLVRDHGAAPGVRPVPEDERPGADGGADEGADDGGSAPVAGSARAGGAAPRSGSGRADGAALGNRAGRADGAALGNRAARAGGSARAGEAVRVRGSGRAVQGGPGRPGRRGGVPGQRGRGGAPPHPRPEPGGVSPHPWPDGGRLRMTRSRTAWALALFFGLQATGAYITMGWMAQIFRDAGVPASTAGLLLAVTMVMGVPLSFVIPRLATRLPHQGPIVVALGLCGLAGYAGLHFAPAAGAWAWALLIGVANCSFPLALTMVGMRARTGAGVAQLSAFAQSTGYLISIPGPLLVGVLYQHSDGWGLPLALMSALLIPQMAVGVLAGRNRTIEDEAAAV
ncbi:MFS transporter [Streptomyces cavernae]|uniref:MFS transporter n=1 Tax=Streptomyces cavernae TaxID=2259034 RepID=UPI0030B814A4